MLKAAKDRVKKCCLNFPLPVSDLKYSLLYLLHICLCLFSSARSTLCLWRVFFSCHPQVLLCSRQCHPAAFLPSVPREEAEGTKQQS